MTNTGTKILLVDDEPELVRYLEKRLSNKGFIVAGATSGREALLLAKKESFDVALVDLKMPGMDGLEVLQRLKELQPFLKAIVLTGHGSIESALQSGTLDVFGYLQKPHDIDLLILSLREAHEAKRAEQQRCYDEEMKQLIERRGTSPQMILADSERLKRKYEQ